MATILKETADEIIAGNGVYPGDSPARPVVKIVEYDSPRGGPAQYGAVYRGQDANAYAPSPYVIRPRIYWERFEEAPDEGERQEHQRVYHP